MATYSATIAKHATLTAGLVDTVTFDREVQTVEILNRGASELYFTTDGSTPVVNGDNNYVVLAGSALKVSNDGTWDDRMTVVKLVSSVGIAYSVTAATV